MKNAAKSLKNDGFLCRQGARRGQGRFGQGYQESLKNFSAPHFRSLAPDTFLSFRLRENPQSQ